MPDDLTEQRDTEPRAAEGAGLEDAAGSAPDATDEAVVAGTPVVVRRHAGVAALVGAAASTVAIAYLWRASQTMGVLDWALFGVMSLIAAVHLSALVDARTPLLVADDLGVRIRLGHEWRGLPWEAIGQVVVHPRRSLLRDGRLVFTPHSLARALDGLDAKARRHVSMNQKMLGAALAVPLGTTTRVSASGGRSVADEIAALALGRADVVELDPSTLDVVDPDGADDGRHGEAPSRGETSPTAASSAGTAPGAPGSAATAPGVTAPGATGPGQTATGEGASGEAAPDEAAPDEAGGRTQDATRSDETRPGDAVAADVDVTDTFVGDAEQGSEKGTEQHRREVFPRVHEDAVPVEGGDAGPQAVAAPADTPAEGGGDTVPSRPLRRSILGGIGTIISRVAKGRAHDVDGDPGRSGLSPGVETALGTSDGAPAGTSEGAPARKPDGDLTDPGHGPQTPSDPQAPVALRETRPGLRAEATIDVPPTAGSAALDPAEAAEGRELRRPGSVDLVFERVDVDERVRPISTLGDPVEPLVIDDYVTEPAYDPVIGPGLTAARTRLGLSVDDLAERTRIRPHVIESIEVDDFAPCGGDFYARGHLRTLARILGKDPEPLLRSFEERYATAPVNARRVFEAELATGMTGSMRSTVGGPSWGLLVGVVLSLVLVWGVVRLFTVEPTETVEMPAPVIDGSAGLEDRFAGVPAGAAQGGAVEPLRVRLTASQADSQVVVRDGEGRVVFSGEMVLGERKTLRLAPPVRVRAADGGAVEARVDGRERGLLGDAGEPARRTFR